MSVSGQGLKEESRDGKVVVLETEKGEISLLDLLRLTFIVSA